MSNNKRVVVDVDHPALRPPCAISLGVAGRKAGTEIRNRRVPSPPRQERHGTPQPVPALREKAAHRWVVVDVAVTGDAVDFEGALASCPVVPDPGRVRGEAPAARPWFVRHGSSSLSRLCPGAG